MCDYRTEDAHRYKLPNLPPSGHADEEADATYAAALKEHERLLKDKEDEIVESSAMHADVYFQLKVWFDELGGDVVWVQPGEVHVSISHYPLPGTIGIVDGKHYRTWETSSGVSSGSIEW